MHLKRVVLEERKNQPQAGSWFHLKHWSCSNSWVKRLRSNRSNKIGLKSIGARMLRSLRQAAGLMS